MAYEKFIKKGDKVYGPYLYQSKRVDGRVVSEYHGQKELNYKKFILVGAGVLFLAVVIFVLFSSKGGITGKAVFNLDASYQNGEPLNGKLKLALQEGELVPASSKLVFDNNGNLYEYNLKDIVSEESSYGDFYVTGADVSGTGDGYGTQGQKKVYPKVYFVLSILSEQNQVEQIIKNDTAENVLAPEVASETVESQPDVAQEQPIEEAAESQPETIQEETAPVTGGVVSGFFRITGNFLGITGNAVAEFEREVSGEVSAGEFFSYTLQEGERVELKPRSVMTDSKQLEDSDVNLEVQGDKIIITTEYYETESGFGKAYLGNDTKEMVLDISKLGLVLNLGDLKVSIVNSGQEIISLSTILEGGEVTANEAINQPVSEINGSIQTAETNITTPEKIFLPEIFELTEEEKAVLVTAFGNASVQIKEAVEKRGFITIRYELGDYWVENSYISDLSNETLRSFMERDKIKWLRDIVRSISQEEDQGRKLEGFLGNSSG